MIAFMVLSAPRSASTWVSNWLTTEHSLCLHDPVLEHDIEDLDRIPCTREIGLSCTGLGLLCDFVNGHPARKVIVHRPLDQVNRSLRRAGLTDLSAAWDGALERIQGLHVSFTDLFRPASAAEIYQHLTHRLFDGERHALLTRMHIDPEFDKVPTDRARHFRERIQRSFQCQQ